MIWHELSQSAGYIDWQKLPFMFVHVDISFDYLAAMARYVSTSGDIAFARESWASVAAAYGYCLASIGPDHLPHIPPDKEASDEQHRPADDLNLSASWLTAAAGYAELARSTGHSQESAAALEQVEQTRQAIAGHYWNATGNFWFDGHTATGEPIYREAIGPAYLIGKNVFPPAQDKALLDRLTSADFQADWGTREVAASAKDYNPYSYGAGSVSPVSTISAATGLWQAHRPESAYGIWSALMQWNSFDSMGHVHEVLAGNFYQEQTESVPEQTWSSAALIDGTVRGLFGLTLDASGVAAADISGQALGSRMTLAPHLPARWSTVSLENVRLGQSTLAFTIRQGIHSLDLDTRNEGPPVTVLFDPQIPLGANLLGAEFERQKIKASIESSGSDEHARVTLNVPSGESHLHLGFAGGVTISLDAPPLRVGAPSTTPKIISVHLDGKILRVDADISAGHDAILTLRTPWKILEAPAYSVRSLAENEYEVRIAAPSSPTRGYTRTQISLRLKQE